MNQLADAEPGFRQALLRAIPPQAQRLLVFGPAGNSLAAALQTQEPDRTVQMLDRQGGGLSLKPGSFECILYDEVLGHCPDPVDLLRRHRPLLTPGGIVLAGVANAQHHAVLAALLTGDFPCACAGLSSQAQLGCCTYSSVLKLLLDAGFAPSLADLVRHPCPSALAAALQPLLTGLRLHAGRTRNYLDISHYVVRGAPYPADAAAAETDEPLSFVACVSDETQLHANLLSSPDLAPGSPHEVLLAHACRSAADGLNEGLSRARHRLVVGVHQDVYLPRGWARRFVGQFRQAEQRYGAVGVAGVYGIARQGRQPARAGRVVDRDRLLWERPQLPAVVESLDELLLALPRDTSLRFEPRLGFHFYGTDICLQARRQGLVAVVLDALCLHNSRSVGLPESFYPSAGAFAAKWVGELPLATSCVQIDRHGRMAVW